MWTLSAPIPGEDSSEEEEDTDTHNTPTSGAVADMLDKWMDWYEQQKECTASSLLLLQK